VFDNDGDGLGAGIFSEFCSGVVPNGWVNNSSDTDDDCYSNYHDCAGVCDGVGIVQTYWNDGDGDGLGAGDGEDICSSDVPSGWVLNSDDVDDNCYSNFHDCAGVCNGFSQINTYYYDGDGDGDGDGIEQDFCSSDVPDGWVLNNADSDDNCYSNIHDCMDVCDGSSEFLTYYQDNDGDGLGTGDGQDFCSADVPDGWVPNSDDEDDNCYSNYHDCAGICDGDAVVQTYWNDSDGDGMGTGIGQDFCSADVPSGWVPNNDDVDDNCFSNIIDECGVCNGDDSSCSGCPDEDAFNSSCHAGELPPCNDDITIDDGSCIYYPDQFIFNQSQLQAFYIVENAGIQQDEVEDLEIFRDWIGVFKEDVCVGAYPWVGNMTTVPAMGDDGSSLTEYYLLNGDSPTFQIYDGSDSTYIDIKEITITNYNGSVYTGWENWGFFFIEEMLGSVLDSYSIALDGVDLISFYSLPENDSVATIFSQVEDSNPKILGEGTSAFYYADSNQWLGTLTEIVLTDGYWVVIDGIDTLDVEGVPTESSTVYDLHLHTNLISYPFAGSAPIAETIPSDVQGAIDAILGEGTAAKMASMEPWTSEGIVSAIGADPANGYEMRLVCK
jgi:hypothetical protein